MRPCDEAESMWSRPWKSTKRHEGCCSITFHKQLGNAVTIPVVEWIMSRLVEVDERTKDN